MITKKKLTEYLIDKGIYNDVDEWLVDEFIYNLKLIKEAKTDVEKRGTIMNIAKEGNKPYYQKNFSLSTIETATKTLLQLSKKLALSPFDRATLKLDDLDNMEDGF